MYPTELKAGIQIDTYSVYMPIILYTSVIAALFTIIKSWKQSKCPSTNKWIKQNVFDMLIYTCNGILFSHKKKWSSDTCYHKDEPWKHYAKWPVRHTKKQILHDSTYIQDLE